LLDCKKIFAVTAASNPAAGVENWQVHKKTLPIVFIPNLSNATEFHVYQHLIRRCSPSVLHACGNVQRVLSPGGLRNGASSKQ
jgi:hypothetical protein